MGGGGWFAYFKMLMIEKPVALPYKVILFGFYFAAMYNSLFELQGEGGVLFHVYIEHFLEVNYLLGPPKLFISKIPQPPPLEIEWWSPNIEGVNEVMRVMTSATDRTFHT